MSLMPEYLEVSHPYVHMTDKHGIKINPSAHRAKILTLKRLARERSGRHGRWGARSIINA
jgi:hypothetical protein